MTSYAGTISSQQKAIIQGIVDSAVFDAEPIPSSETKKTEEFIYEDNEGGVEFTVPANWSEETLSKERETIDTKFMSNEETGMAILYGSSDIWNDWMTDDDKAGYTRSEMDNSAFVPSNIAMLLDVEPSDVITKVFGGKEYFYNVSRKTDTSSGMSIDMITAVRFYDGYYYQFQFSGDEDNKYYKDFISLLESVNYINEEVEVVDDTIGEENSDDSSVSLNDDQVGLIVIAILALVSISAFLIWRKNKKDRENQSVASGEHQDNGQVFTYEKTDSVLNAKNDDSSITEIMEREHRLEQVKSDPNRIVCPECELVLDNDSNFCPYCGSAITHKNEEQK